MIRVGFIMGFGDKSWMGGVNYFKNLLLVISRDQGRRIDPVILCAQKHVDECRKDFPGLETIGSDIFDSSSLGWRLSKVKQRVFGKDARIDRFLKTNNIRLLSHSGHLGKKSEIPTLAWIPDFQHTRMPDFFGEAEIHNRNMRFKRICNYCSGVLVSSEDARNDLRNFCEKSISKSHVLRFVSCLASNEKADGGAILKEVYGIEGKFFYLPNQFWVHKNHHVVLRAINLLKSEGKNIRVIFTGNPKDSRQAESYNNLMMYVSDNDLESHTRFLGLIPYQHLVVLQSTCVAIINPSFFEGWSTTVEEAKTLGKAVILSDIPVHREQNPERCAYFDPHDERSLADIMWAQWNSYSGEVEQAAMAKAEEKLPARMQGFSDDYQNIVFEVLKQYSARS